MIAKNLQEYITLQLYCPVKLDYDDDDDDVDQTIALGCQAAPPTGLYQTLLRRPPPARGGAPRDTR